PAQGLFSGLPFVKPAGKYYAGLAKDFQRAAARPGRFRDLFALAHAFCDFLAVKADLRRRAVAAYKKAGKSDKRALQGVIGDIAVASKKLAAFRRRYRNYWLTERHP